VLLSFLFFTSPGSIFYPTGNQAQQLLGACYPRAWNSISRKTLFAERIQVDLGRPVPPEKIFRFSRR
jgi:hypothetical protein